MFKYLSNIITSRNPNLFYLQMLLFLAILLVGVYLLRVSKPPVNTQEGFNQDKPYVLKQNQQIYDDFFAEMYDSVNNRDKVCQRELFQIIKMTEPTVKNSIFLDVGSGTGCVLDELTNAGYSAYGIDKSAAMTDYAETLHPNVDIKTADVLDPMVYENGIFTHIMCLNFTIYELDSKSQFFSNCYYWMKPNAYLIVHLVNRDKLGTKKYLKHMGVPSLFTRFLPETDNDSRKTSTSVDFNDCKYEENYDFPKDSKNVVFAQTFTDKVTKNVRRNEQTLKIESIDEILDMAKRAGFIVHSMTGMKGIVGDDNQYLYVLERTL